MRTLVFVLVGALLAFAGQKFVPLPWRTLAAVAFTLAWLAVSAWNLSVGMSHGYTFAQELPIHVVLFGVPALVAWGMWWWLRR